MLGLFALRAMVYSRRGTRRGGAGVTIPAHVISTQPTQRRANGGSFPPIPIPAPARPMFPDRPVSPPVFPAMTQADPR